MVEDQSDIAMVGGGIAGLYCCYHRVSIWKPKEKEQFGCLRPPIGSGKIETWRIDPKAFTKRIQRQTQTHYIF